MSIETAKHTPGPWTFYDDSNNNKTNKIEIVALGKTVANIYHSVSAEDLPNARLIAAAPNLLSCLEELRDRMLVRLERGVAVTDDHPDQIALKNAERAIVKAKGKV
jgi:hypothetical protein